MSIGSLLFTTALCLPSLIGGAALLVQLALYRDINEWREVPSALIALGTLLGAPLVAMAAVVGGVIALSRSLSTRVKYAHLFLVGLAAIATWSLMMRFTK